MSKEMTLTLKVPEKLEPIQTRVEARKNYFPYWDRHPLVQVDPKDEAYEILRNFAKKKLIKGAVVKTLLVRGKPIEKYFLVDVVTEVVRNLISMKNSSDYERFMRKTGLLATEVDDLMRLMDRYEKELTWKGISVKKTRELMSTVMNDLKETQRGIVKVVRVEGQKDGSTVLHLVLE
jgi:hypothetical protein